MAQDDYYYEIQLTNKQLVFYFMAGATGLILSFLAGVMVGRDAQAGASEVQAARPVQEERVVAEEPARPAPPPTEDLTYAQRLEAEKTEDVLERPKPAAGGVTSRPAPGRPAPAGSPTAKATTAPARVVPSAPPSAAAPPPKPAPVKAAPPEAAAQPAASAPRGGSFTIQVGAFKDRASADRVVMRLKSKGFPAYVLAPEGEGLFNVRVGAYEGRDEAERIQTRLRDEEKYKPFIVKK